VGDLTAADVVAIQHYLRATREDIMTWLPREWVPGWKSAAADELLNREVGDGGVPWGETPVRSSYATAQVFIYAAIDCLGGLADSTNLLSTAYLSNVIARAAMEAGSQAWWLLDPEIGARRRVIRSVLIRAQSAKYLEKAVLELDPVKGQAANYGEDPAKAAAHAKNLGLTCNNVRIQGVRRWTCETETLPTYTERATEFQKHVFAPAAYAIYSGAAHAELYAVSQGWRVSPTTPDLWERRPDRIVVWAAVIVAAGFAAMAALRAILLLGKNARRIDFIHHAENLNSLVRELDLPREWRTP
jgi:hypothetical protein